MSIDDLTLEIDILKQQLIDLAIIRSSLTDQDVLAKSQELDAKLYQLWKVKRDMKLTTDPV